MTNFSFRLPAIRLNDRPARTTQRPQRALARRAERRPGTAWWDDAPVWGGQIAARPIGLSDASHASDSGATAPESASWFESTWDLREGLDVAEVLPADLPLELWLQVCVAA